MSHEYYCPTDDGDLCTPDNNMHLGLHKCFVEPLIDKDGKSTSTIDKCQASEGTNLFDDTHPNPVKNAGRLDGDATK